MKIVSYNLFEGAVSTKTELAEFVAEQQPDVLCLQEANGWGDDNLQILSEFAEKVEMPYFKFGDTNRRFKLATLAKIPIVESEMLTVEFWHGALRTTFQKGDSKVDLINLHLNPQNESSRLAEIKLLSSILVPNAAAILTGDLNSLSSHDQYDPELIKRLNQKGITKFGIDQIEYEVLNFAEQNGLFDVAMHLGRAEWSVPTPANNDPHHTEELRLVPCYT